MHHMETTLTEYDMRKKFLKIEAVDRSKQILGNLSINLYHIWRGPYHINLPLDMPDAKDARISFNFQISQSIHIHIENIETIMKPKTRKN